MALTNYTTLQASVKDWLKRSSATGVSTADLVPDFIAIGEDEIFRRLRVRAMESAGTLTCVSGTAAVALPTRFKAFKWLYVAGNPVRKLEYASGEQLYQTYSGSTNAKPFVFSYSGENLLLGPTPDSGYTLNYLAYIAPAALSTSATNTLFPTYPTIYLYAALKAAFNFLEQDSEVRKYEALLTQAIELAQKEDSMDRHSGSTLRARAAVAGP